MTDSARYDLRLMTPLQQELHSAEDDVIGSCFIDSFNHSERNASNRVPLKPVKSTKGVVEYVIEDNFDFIVSSSLVQEIPSIKVLDEYKENVQIRWPDYFGLCLAKTAKFKTNENLVINTLTPISLYHYMKNIMDHRSYKTYLRLIGHRDELIKWTSHLKATTIGVPLPWFYTFSSSYGFPMYLIKDRKKIIHWFEFQPIDKLLRMRYRANPDEPWKDIPFDSKYLSYKTTNDKYLEVPDLIAKMVVVEDDFKKALICNMKDIKRNGDDYKEWYRYIDDFVVIHSSEEFKEGYSGFLQLNDPAPCKALSFCAMNSQAYKYNNYFDFTDGENGWPIISYSLSYGHAARIPETSIFLNELDTYNTLPTNFDAVGLATHCFDLTLEPNIAASGPVFAGLNAVFKVQFKEPEDEANASKYTLVTILWTTKKLSLLFDKDDKETILIEPKITLK